MGRKSEGTHGGCSTCTGMYGSCVRIGMIGGITSNRRELIRRGLVEARSGVYRGGACNGHAASCRSAYRNSYTRPATATTTAACVSPSVLSSPRLSASGRREPAVESAPSTASSSPILTPSQQGTNVPPLAFSNPFLPSPFPFGRGPG